MVVSVAWGVIFVMVLAGVWALAFSHGRERGRRRGDAEGYERGLAAGLRRVPSDTVISLPASDEPRRSGWCALCGDMGPQLTHKPDCPEAR